MVSGTINAGSIPARDAKRQGAGDCTLSVYVTGHHVEGAAMGIRCGVDIVETARIQRMVDRLGARFLNRVFTPLEQADCATRGAGGIRSLAVRFAAKEAVSKALGTGIGAGAAFTEIEIYSDADGSPQVRLSGSAAVTFGKCGGTELAISLTHEKAYCVAQAVMLTATR